MSRTHTTLPPTHLTLSIQGRSTIHRRAERAAMAVAIAVEGPTQDQVSTDIHSTIATLRTLLNKYTPKDAETGEATADAPITHWSMTTLSTNSNVPNDRAGNPLPRQFTANTAFTVKFRDFARLGSIASELTKMPFVKIHNISWRLTDATKDSLGSQSRRAAVEDAVAKARDFASPVAEGKMPRAVEITEQGFTTATASHGRPRKQMMGAAGAGEPKTDGMEFEPEDVQLTASALVKFIVD